ncbi:MAG TPA: archaeal proteasome endopeptidase complex subunit alpha [Candidatus Aenigmarchaeota archaeon]|nr:archaeal proteasome endopeptidase complex subunit alpha [Candidatus Aenigmarchaeota archaeon]
MEMLPQYMAYDRTIAVFSPDGRLFQVEYAKEAVKKGTTSVGITFKDGVVLATVKPKTELLVIESIEKIFQIDDHIGAVASGLLADARVLMETARIKAQINRITYEEPITVWNLSRVIGDRMQVSTLYAGLRPFGVGFLVGGVDSTGPHLIEVDPSGMLYEWRAYAIGKGATVANKILRKKWKPDMNEKDALKLAKDVIMKSEKDVETSSIEMVVIKDKFRVLNEDEIKKV